MKQTHITITSKAAAYIADILSREPYGTMLRVSVSGGGCSGFRYEFTLDHNRTDDDMLILQEGIRVVVDPLSLQYMEGSEIDLSDNLLCRALQIRNPNATASCGCGTSFSV